MKESKKHHIVAAVVDPRPSDQPIDDLATLASWATAARPSFSSRREFNVAVCDRIAAAGLVVNPATVLRVGAWGNTTSVQTDVELWYRELAQRLGNLEAEIPLGARRMANHLLTQLWHLASNEVDQRLVEPLRQEYQLRDRQIDGLKVELGRAQDGLQTLQQTVDDLRRDLQQATQDADRSRQRHEQDIQALEVSCADKLREAALVAKTERERLESLHAVQIKAAEDLTCVLRDQLVELRSQSLVDQTALQAARELIKTQGNDLAQAKTALGAREMQIEEGRVREGELQNKLENARLASSDAVRAKMEAEITVKLLEGRLETAISAMNTYKAIAEKIAEEDGHAHEAEQQITSKRPMKKPSNTNFKRR